MRWTQKGAALCKANGVDFILAVGGGSVVDCCNVISAQALTEKDMWELEYTDHGMPEKFLPMGAVWARQMPSPSWTQPIRCPCP